MADRASALGGVEFIGFVTVTETAAPGMITLRGDPGGAAVAAALDTVGLPVPGRRQRVASGARAALWMAPDEVLVMLPRAELAAALAGMQGELAGAHALLADVSDARTVFTLSNGPVREVLAKLCPVDLHPDTFPAGEVRRTRAGQVPVAFWIDETGAATIICFRSVAQYLSDILCLSAQPGSSAGLFPPAR